MARPWQTLSQKKLGEHRILTLREDRCVSPRTGAAHDFVVIECPDWVNVIALTPQQEVLLIRQYRFGTAAVTLEIPGGMVDAGEEPQAAAQRELLEETGYTAECFLDLGSIRPNPALQTNRCHTFLAQGCRSVNPPELDEMEDIETVLVPLAEVPGLLGSGAIDHALVAVAFQRLELWQRGLVK